jgi:hypothetical protein
VKNALHAEAQIGHGALGKATASLFGVREARAEKALFYVVGEHKSQTAYYCGWWHTCGEPLLAHHPSLGAKTMTRANANRVRRRLESPEIWGGTWRLEEV